MARLVIVIPARTSYRKSLKLYFGNQSKIGTKYCNAVRKGLLFLNCLKGSSGKSASFAWDLNVVPKRLGVAKLTLAAGSFELGEAMEENRRGGGGVIVALMG